MAAKVEALGSFYADHQLWFVAGDFVAVFVLAVLFGLPASLVFIGIALFLDVKWRQRRPGSVTRDPFS